MRLVKDTNPGARNVSVPCIQCGTVHRLCDSTIDADGPAFRAYYCPSHTPVTCERCGSTHPNDRSCLCFDNHGE